VWSNGNMREIRGPRGSTFARALDVNEDGQAVGSIGTPGPRATLFDRGHVVALDGFASEFNVSWAHAINNRGDIVGYNGTKAVLWLASQ
jgi:uncharacterized membrane protein